MLTIDLLNTKKKRSGQITLKGIEKKNDYGKIEC